MCSHPGGGGTGEGSYQTGRSGPGSHIREMVIQPNLFSNQPQVTSTSNLWHLTSLNTFLFANFREMDRNTEPFCIV